MQSHDPSNNKEKAMEGEASNTTQKMMGGEEGVRTVDCLRGRLLAERVASKAAKEEADFMGEMLIELERQLKIETKSRNRAEKKLKLAMKKLESLNPPSPLPQFSLSESEGSISSSTCLSGKKETEEQGPVPQTSETRDFRVENKAKTTEESIIKQDSRTESSATTASSPVHQMLSYEESSSSVSTAHYHDSEDPSRKEGSKNKAILRSDGYIIDALRQSSMELGQDQMENDENPLAMVPSNLWPDSDTKQASNNANIHEVLAALQSAKEQLRSSIGRSFTICSPSFELYGI